MVPGVLARQPTPSATFLQTFAGSSIFGPLEKLYDSQLGGLYRLQATAYCPPGSASGAPLSAAHGPRSTIGRVGSLQFFPRVIVAATKVLSTSYTLEHSLLQVGEVYGDLFLVPDGYTSQVSLIQMGESFLPNYIINGMPSMAQVWMHGLSWGAEVFLYWLRSVASFCLMLTRAARWFCGCALSP